MAPYATGPPAMRLGKQIADWLSMYEAAVRSSGAGGGERQGEISRNLGAGKM